MGENGLDLGVLRQVADQQAMKEKLIVQAVNEAIQNPMKITRLQVCSVAYVAEQELLMIGLADGERIDIPLTDQTKRMLAEAFA